MAILAMGLTYILVWGNSANLILAALLYAGMVCLLDSALLAAGIALYFMGIYSYAALYRIAVFFGCAQSGNQATAILFSFVISFIPLFLKDRKIAMLRMILLEGILLPFSLLVYTANQYKYGEELVVIDVPATVKLLIAILLLVFTIESLLKAKRNWNSPASLDSVISLGSCISIIAFNRYSGTGAVMSYDFHHPFENIIGYSQIFELGQKPFSEYIPVSGMYSVVHGAFFKFFGEGLFQNYYLATNVYYLFVIILLVLILRWQLEPSYVLLISLVYYFYDYNRTIFILPVICALICPKLIARKNAWLVTWYLTSLFYGLYYPVYGAACCLSLLPLGIWQIVTFVKTGELKKNVRTISFWIPWIVCAGLTIVSFPLLLGTLKHTLAMSGQSVMADSIARFGSFINDDFFTYLLANKPVVRLALWYLISFGVPVFVCIVAYAMSIKTAELSFKENRLHVGNFKALAVILSAVIMPLVSYSFSAIRTDIQVVYARTLPILVAEGILLMIFAWRYLQNGISRLIIIALSAALPVSAGFVGIDGLSNDSKLEAYYTVPEEYVYLEDDRVALLGTGFLEPNIYSSIEYFYEKYNGHDESFFSMGTFGYYYLTNIKGTSVMEDSTVTGFSAAKETVDILRANDAIVGPVDSCEFYYLYNYLMTSGEYYWDAGTETFMPNNGKYTLGEVNALNNGYESENTYYYMGKNASSWGNSMDSLEEIFTEPELEYETSYADGKVNVSFSQELYGNDADFIYLEFDGMDQNYDYTLFGYSYEVSQAADGLCKYFMHKSYNTGMTVKASWTDDDGNSYSVDCTMGEGKLLIPLGAGSKWLLNKHDSLTLTVYQDRAQIELPTISDLRFLKLREAR